MFGSRLAASLCIQIGIGTFNMRNGCCWASVKNILFGTKLICVLYCILCLEYFSLKRDQELPLISVSVDTLCNKKLRFNIVLTNPKQINESNKNNKMVVA